MARPARARLLTLDHLDGRTLAVKRVRQVEAEITSDLGGETNLTETQRQLLRRTAVLASVLESEETKWAAGDEEFDLAQYTNATNTLRRLCVTIGLARLSRDVTLLGDD